MSTPDPGMYRVAVHADTAHTDLTLPSGVPVAALIASVVDLMPQRTGPESLRPYRLSEPGRTALDGTKTLSQQGIRDGATLVLTQTECPAPVVQFVDPAEQVAAIVRAAARPWTTAARRLIAALAASGLTGVAGFVAIPGGPGAPNALLAVAATGAVALMTVPPSGCNALIRTIMCGLAGLALLTAVAGIAAAATGVSPSAVGAAAVVAGFIGIRAAGRVADAVTGLSRRPNAPTSHVDQAFAMMTGMVAAAAALVTLGVAAVVTGAPAPGVPRAVGLVFTVAAGAALALRARSHADGTQVVTLLSGGGAAAGIALVAAATCTGRLWPAVVATVLAGLILGLGFASVPPSPLVSRTAEAVEGLALGALVPLACWLCGGYSLVSRLSLG